MLCSGCNNRILPVVAVDIDGTLADYHEHLIWFSGLYFGRHFPSPGDLTGYRGEQSMSEWFSEHDVDIASYRAMKLAFRQGSMKRSMPVFDFGYGFTHQMIGRAEIWITTTRPYLRLDQVDPDTRFWLERNGIKYDALLYDEDKYAVLLSSVGKDRVIAIVDDLREQLESAAELFGPSVPIKRESIWNEKDGLDWIHSYRDLGLIRDVIMKRIEIWEHTHG
jgi:hypothetical protein